MNVKETKTRVKNWCEEHSDVLYYTGMAATGALIGVCFGGTLGAMINRGYDRTYKMASLNSYDKGRSDAIAVLLRDNNNSEVVKALAEHMTKYCND